MSMSVDFNATCTVKDTAGIPDVTMCMFGLCSVNDHITHLLGFRQQPLHSDFTCVCTNTVATAIAPC